MDPPRQQPTAQQINRKRQHYRSQLINNPNRDDPLAIYDKFIHWTIKNYPDKLSGDSESGLTALLKEATSKFKDDEEYKMDRRYHKMWSLYARRVQQPWVVYKDMLDSGIGTTSGLIFEEYAKVLEREGR